MNEEVLTLTRSDLYRILNPVTWLGESEARRIYHDDVGIAQRVEHDVELFIKFAKELVS